MKTSTIHCYASKRRLSSLFLALLTMIGIIGYDPNSAHAILLPTGNSISVPSDGLCVPINSQNQFSGSSGTDMDECPTVQDNCVLHWWGSGSFTNDGVGESVTWTAPGTPGTYTINAAGDDTGTPDTNEYDWPSRDQYKVTRTVKAVQVDKVQTQNDGTWEDVSGTVYVLKGTTANFKAIKNPSDASWPSGKPVWGGSSGASGSGETKSVTFNTVSLSPTDYKTVSCECGNTITVNVIVFELTGALTPADDFSGRSQGSYGLEEFVNLTHTTNPTGLSPSLQWKRISGVGSVNGTTYDAGASQGNVTLKLEVTAGPSKGQGPTYDRSVVKPDGGYMVQKPNTGIKHAINTCSCGFLGISYVAPWTVSFTNLQTREGSCTGTGTGFFSSLNGKQHPTGSWQDVEDGNIATGCKEGYTQDEIDSGEYPGPYSVGEFAWPIPVEYKADDGVVHTLTTDQNHHQNADAQGKCTISKYGAGPFSRNAGDATSNW